MNFYNQSLNLEANLNKIQKNLMGKNKKNKNNKTYRLRLKGLSMYI